MLHAVILYSVGSPEALTVPQLRRFLQRFLSDKRVVQLPSFLWQPILQSFILRTRPHRLIKRYEQIFVDGHNPYLATMERLCVDLEDYLNERQTMQNETTLAAKDALALSQSFANPLFAAESNDSSDSSASNDSDSSATAPSVREATTVADATTAITTTADAATASTAKSSATAPATTASTKKAAAKAAASAKTAAKAESQAATSSPNSTSAKATSAKPLSKKTTAKSKATAAANANSANTTSAIRAQDVTANPSASPLATLDANTSSDSARAGDSENTESAEQQFMVCTSYAFAGITLEEAVKNCLHRGADKITVVPLFPQYSLCTSKTPELKLNALQRQGIKTPINFVHSYTAEPLYINSLITQITQALDWPVTDQLPHPSTSSTSEFTATPASTNATHASAEAASAVATAATAKGSQTASDTSLRTTQLGTWLSQNHAHILLAYHGLPRAYLRTGEPYAAECRTTTDQLGSALGLTANEHYSVAFLGRMGPVKWMQPSLEEAVERLLQERVQHLIVLAPSFAIDCLETLYDINIKLREFFLHKGGDQFTFIPALNDSTSHIALLAQLIATAQPLKP